MDYYSRTGLTAGQLAMLTLLAGTEIGSLTRPDAKKLPVVGLLDSIAMVVMLMRRNSTQAVAGGMPA